MGHVLFGVGKRGIIVTWDALRLGIRAKEETGIISWGAELEAKVEA